ncbi:MAG: sulfur carrier protein ThiS [Prevotella sp.]|nr:sulfur carrier protein ThiS [Prevotella sp.]MBR2016896.1 sulfur carrier protein ThiS [Prevotella sp.]
MKARINNSEREMADGTTIAMIAQAEGLPDRGVAIAVNGEIVQRSAWNEHVINNGDDIIILKAFCGG